MRRVLGNEAGQTHQNEMIGCLYNDKDKNRRHVPFPKTDNTGRTVAWGCAGSKRKFSILNMLNLRCLQSINVKPSSRALDIFSEVMEMGLVEIKTGHHHR